MSDRFEGWAYPLSETVGPLKILDHTFVTVPSKGPAYFNCFGGHAGAGAHALADAAGDGDYAVADCYRLPLPGLPDTAGLGLYATHGVCHQAANRFLYSACGWFSGPTIHNAQGYALSFALYGTYGRPLEALPPPAPYIPLPTAPWDFVAIYAGCKAKHGFVGEAKPAGFHHKHQKAVGFAGRITALHRAVEEKSVSLDANALLQEQFRILAEERLGPRAPVPMLLEWQRKMLSRVHPIATKTKGEALAHEVNQSIARSLDDAAKDLGPAAFEKLFGFPSTERYGVIDPRLADIAARG